MTRKENISDVKIYHVSGMLEMAIVLGYEPHIECIDNQVFICTEQVEAEQTLGLETF